MFHHLPGQYVATGAARQLPELSELSQQEVLTILMGHPVLNRKGSVRGDLVLSVLILPIRVSIPTANRGKCLYWKIDIWQSKIYFIYVRTCISIKRIYM